MIFLSSFQGGEHTMGQLYQDAMAKVRKFGKPDLFVTFTCNPKWKEITDVLLLGQTAKDRPKLVTRVFNLKLDALLKDIKDSVLGNVIAKILVIKFQKRGLPHVHILDEASKLRIVEDYNLMVSVKIPDLICHPKAKETHCDVDGYFEYRRCQTRIFVDPKTQCVVDNRWIVSYNLHLATKYHAHFNMEICSSISTVKYLYKYVYKGPDCATAIVERQANMLGQENNRQAIVANGEWQNRYEIKAYLEGRYVSASEASWRLFSFRMQGGTPSVTCLAMHEPRMHTVMYNDNASIAVLLLSGGRTAHSYLKIPIALDRMSCYIRKQDDLAALIRQTKLILWDNALMTNKLAFKVVDRTLRDLTNRNEPFGGIIFVMSGDFH
ncbi:hypothetical protein BDL97_09G015800 [Sphagnum fallax]|nr:hypothetical protein BDL97_09G015800 [Sphagnum fallax]